MDIRDVAEQERYPLQEFVEFCKNNLKKYGLFITPSKNITVSSIGLEDLKWAFVLHRIKKLAGT